MTSTWILGLHTSPIKEQEKNKNKSNGTYKLTIHYKKMVVVVWGGILMVLLTSWVNTGLHPILHTSYQVPDDLLMAQTLVCKNRKCHSYIHLLYIRLYRWHSPYLVERKHTEVLNIFNKRYSDSQCTITCIQLLSTKTTTEEQMMGNLMKAYKQKQETKSQVSCVNCTHFNVLEHKATQEVSAYFLAGQYKNTINNTIVKLWEVFIMHPLQVKYKTSKEQFGACHTKFKLQIYVCVPVYATWHGLPNLQRGT